MLSVVMLNVIMVNVVAPDEQLIIKILLVLFPVWKINYYFKFFDNLFFYFKNGKTHF
jgi:hypothetical protein